VRRIVHVSVSNPDEASPLAYFRGKALCERGLRELGSSHAIVRPTLVFGPEDILLNNIAWILRRFPLFLVPGDGRYSVQPVSVQDTARIAADVGAREDDAVVDAAGPQRLSFGELVRLIGDLVGARARIRCAPPRLALGLTRIAGFALRDLVLTRESSTG
jgi:NADH dehydrogenase